MSVFEQLLDIRFSRAVKDRRRVRNAVNHCASVLDQLGVGHLGKPLLPLGTGEHIAVDLSNLVDLCAVCKQVADALPDYLRRPAKVSLENLAYVHTRRYAERV